jgi:MOSC domain-containing protein YiiM
VTAGTIGLVSVNVSFPKALGMHRGQLVTSGIAKVPAPEAELWLGATNLEGDGQADLSVHGGPDKAVYAYPSEHFEGWAAELEQEIGPGAFGENLTTSGATEDDVCIGDRWTWGDAVLEVCQPRSPCYKLTMHRGRGDVGRRMRETDRSGWYLRVLQEGSVPVAGPVEVVERHPVGATVRLVHQASRPGVVPDEIVEMLLLLDPLADSWKRSLASRLGPPG